MNSVPRIDLMLVIGTSGQLSEGFIDEARAKGAVVAHFDLKRNENLIRPGDWFVPGDVSDTLPKVIAEAVGNPLS